MLVGVCGQVREASFGVVGIRLAMARRLHGNDEATGRFSEAYTRYEADLCIQLVRCRTVAETPQMLT